METIRKVPGVDFLNCVLKKTMNALRVARTKVDAEVVREKDAVNGGFDDFNFVESTGFDTTHGRSRSSTPSVIVKSIHNIEWLVI